MAMIGGGGLDFVGFVSVLLTFTVASCRCFLRVLLSLVTKNLVDLNDKSFKDFGLAEGRDKNASLPLFRV